MPPRWCALWIVIAACGARAGGPFQPVTLHVVATDRAGKPVTDLQPADFRIVDNGASIAVASARLSPHRPPPTLAVLLDLMDLTFEQRGAEAKQLRAKLAPSRFLYLLGADGHIYPAPAAADSVAAFDLALRNAPQQRPEYFAQHPEERFKSAYAALDFVDHDLSRLPGPKQLIWISYGVPNQIRLQGQGWTNLGPMLRQLAAHLNRDEITLYTVDPSPVLGTLDRQGLEALTAATGGRSFSSSDLSLALNQARTDAASSYVLEYAAPLAGNYRGKLHIVRVASDRKGVHLRTQLAYLTKQ